MQKRHRANPAPEYRFQGQRWIVTGATGGIGKAIALGAAKAGAEVLALGRDPAKLDQLKLDAGADAARILPISVDLANVKACTELAARVQHVDVLVHNVGVMLHDFKKNIEGIEQSFATNVLAPFAMTEQLIQTSAINKDSKILLMTSGGAYGAKLDLAALEASSAEQHDGFVAYSQHKRAQIELARWWNSQAVARCYAMQPGWVDTAGVRHSLPIFRKILQKFLRNAEQGADIALWLAASAPELHPDGGVWLDRVRDTEHMFALTEGGAAAKDLVSALRARLPQAA